MSHNYFRGSWPPIDKRQVKKDLLEIQKNECFYCHRQLELRKTTSRRYATLDHIVPLKMGGGWTFSNLVVACWECNHAKGHMSAPEFMAQLTVMV